jgi:hypothetical protein
VEWKKKIGVQSGMTLTVYAGKVQMSSIKGRGRDSDLEHRCRDFLRARLTGGFVVQQVAKRNGKNTTFFRQYKTDEKGKNRSRKIKLTCSFIYGERIGFNNKFRLCHKQVLCAQILKKKKIFIII